MNKTILLLANLLFFSFCNAQSFEGIVEFRMETSKDTTTNMYYVKDNTVKLDQIGRRSGKVEGSFIFNLTSNEIKFVNPIRKVWGEHKSDLPAEIKGTCVVVKGTNTKVIQGLKCTEYIVKNQDENTQVTYWITGSKYDFFIPLIKLWNRKDKQSVYFNQIKDLPKGSMPLLSEEKQISDSKLVSKLEVSKITKSTVDEAKLTIPTDYRKFDQK